MTTCDRSFVVADPRFFAKAKGPFSSAVLADIAKAKVVPRKDGGIEPAGGYVGIAPIQAASMRDVSFLDNRRYLSLLDQTQAGLVIVESDFIKRVPSHCVALVTSDPYLAWSRVARLFYPSSAVIPGVHATASVASTALIDPSAQIEAFAVIGDNVEVGAGCFIGAHTVIGAGVRLGQACRIGSHVSISYALVGNRVTVSHGSRIGQDGFGFALGPVSFETMPHLGRVILEDDVEIGANSTIDRGSVNDTIIGAGSRIDNLVQIGHNVQMGRCCIVVSQAGISGSTVLEDYVTVAAQAGLVGHIRIGNKVRVGAQCGVMSDVEAGQDVIGSPAMPVREFFRNVAVLRKLSKKWSKLVRGNSDLI
ncbi:MAG: UDP-3-O-(3-hydroxymyristoyl)glucosamine N-acyltransferase [Acetobacter sp.]|nr:UDP-3-O-(3-hydroxymyristoyl)glucosamine N-acyltransferase [Acetobacter sp.]